MKALLLFLLAFQPPLPTSAERYGDASVLADGGIAQYEKRCWYRGRDSGFPRSEFSDTITPRIWWPTDGRPRAHSYTLTVFTQRSPEDCADYSLSVAAFGVREIAQTLFLPGATGATLLVDPLIIVPLAFFPDQFGWQVFELDIPIPIPVDHAVQVAVVIDGVVMTSAAIRVEF